MWSWLSKCAFKWHLITYMSPQPCGSPGRQTSSAGSTLQRHPTARKELWPARRPTHTSETHKVHNTIKHTHKNRHLLSQHRSQKLASLVPAVTEEQSAILLATWSKFLWLQKWWISHQKIRRSVSRKRTNSTLNNLNNIYRLYIYRLCIFWGRGLGG